MNIKKIIDLIPNIEIEFNDCEYYKYITYASYSTDFFELEFDKYKIRAKLQISGKINEINDTRKIDIYFEEIKLWNENGIIELNDNYHILEKCLIKSVIL